MDIHARHIAVNGRYKQLLPPTSLRVADGQLALVRCLREEATTLALALSGRIEPDDGAVLLDGVGDQPTLRELVAVVDAPRVTEPEPSLPLGAVVAESLGLAGAPAGRATVHDWLVEQRAEQYTKYRFETLPAPLRTRLLVELAVVDERVGALVFDSPDRHTGDAQTWWSVALRQAQRGLAVIVLCADGTARSLHPESAKVGQMQQPPPILVGPDGVQIADVRPTDPSFGTQYGDVYRSEHDEPVEHDYDEQTAGHDADYYDESSDDESSDDENGDEAPTTVQPVVLDDEPRLGEYQYSEHQYSDAEFSDAEFAEPPQSESSRTGGTGIGARLAGEADPAGRNGDGKHVESGHVQSERAENGHGEQAPKQDPEATTTLNRVSDREDS